MLRETIETGLRMKAIRPIDLKRVNVDTTVQIKAIRYPTDAPLYHRCRARLVKAARAESLAIKQSYENVGKRLLLQSSRYAHARQMKRVRNCTKKLHTQLGRVMREIERQTAEPSPRLAKLLDTAHRVHAQNKRDKNKVYSTHEPEVLCIAKGKAGKPYEFGNKVSVAITSKRGCFLGVKSFQENHYDGHTLDVQLKQVETIIGKRVEEAHVDMGYRKHDYAGDTIVPVDKRCRGRTSRALWQKMKRRAAIEPSIGHLKNERRLERNQLKGMVGYAINSVLSAAGMNFKKLLRAGRAKLSAEIAAFLERLLSRWPPTSLQINLLTQ